MSSRKGLGTAASLAILLILILPRGPLAAAAVKLRVTTEGSTIFAAPSISSQKLANVVLNKILDSEGKQGDFYKVTLDQSGVKITGYIYKEYVEELSDSEAEKLGKQTAAPSEIYKTQADIAAQLENKIEESKDLIRQGKNLDKAVDGLQPLVAKVFSLEDSQKQKEFACRVYFCLGLALARQGDKYKAVQEFRNMYEVDTGFAAAAAKDLFDPSVNELIKSAEKLQQGLLRDYTFSINTEPQGATLKIDGDVIGTSPYVLQTGNPKFTLEVEKDGFASVKKAIFLVDSPATENLPLKSIGRTMKVLSTPLGARVFFDGQDTGKTTDCELPYVPYGEHKIKLTVSNFVDWEGAVQVTEAQGPQTISAVLTVKNYVSIIQKGGADKKFFKFPKAVALDRSGNIYIADESDFKIRKYDSEFRTMNWTDPGLTTRALSVPAGIAFDSQGDMYVTDSGDSCVAKFDKNGKRIGKWGKPGPMKGDLNGPTGIAVDRNNDVYVADTMNNRVVKYSPTGVVKKIFGKKGSGQGDFYSPTAVAISLHDELFVVDRGNGRIQKLTCDGTYLAEFGKPGSGDGELNRPLGLCFDGDGYLYVADTGNNRIQKFTPDGKLVSYWGGKGPSGTLMSSPAGVAVNDKGIVIIVEKDANRIQEFGAPAKYP